jgi:hypothetical protein
MNDYMICIEAYIRWEQLTGRSFQQMNFEDVADLHRLLYCAYLIGQPNPATFEVFEQTLLGNPRLYKQAINHLSRYNTVSAQFASIKQQPTLTEETEPSAPMLLGDVAARLVVSGGLDAHYVMREMTIEDMLRYVKALDEKQRQQAESQRLWTYLSILPHIDKKKCPSPEKMLPFPWEVEALQEASMRVAEQMKDEFERFMRGEL